MMNRVCIDISHVSEENDVAQSQGQKLSYMACTLGSFAIDISNRSLILLPWQVDARVQAFRLQIHVSRGFQPLLMVHFQFCRS